MLQPEEQNHNNGDGTIDPFDPELQVGFVSDSGHSTIKVTVDTGNRNVTCQVGAYIIVHAGTVTVFGQVNNLKLEDSPNGEKVPTAFVSLMNCINFSTGEVTPGVSSRPNLGAGAFMAHPAVVRHVAESKARKDGSELPVSLDLARLSDGHSTPVTITPEMLFGRHMAILGTTGGGKSYTLCRLVEEVAKHRSKTILFDPSGEFGAIESDALHIFIGNDPNPPENFHEVSVPYYHLTENDLFAIFKPSGESQAPKLRQAIKSLKLAAMAPHIALDGLIIKAAKQKIYYEQEYLKHVNEVESQTANFDITKLVRQISNECVNPNRSSTETSYWGDYNSMELSLCNPLTNRVQDITTSANLAPIFQPGEKPSLFDVIDRFLDDENYRVLIVSLQYLSFEHNAREIVANAAGRYLLKLARAERFRDVPILICVDEAHQFLKEKMENIGGDYAMDSFALIAKEGRKYALHICIATQRPRDIPESVLSQMGSLIVHRLINDKDRGIIERASGEADAASMSSLPILTQGQAVLLGAEFPAPLLVKIQMPIKKPYSRSADFQRCWNWAKAPSRVAN